MPVAFSCLCLVSMHITPAMLQPSMSQLHEAQREWVWEREHYKKDRYGERREREKEICLNTYIYRKERRSNAA